jgi:hypothetical protein
VFIARFEPHLQRPEICKRKLVIRGNDSKLYEYLAQQQPNMQTQNVQQYLFQFRHILNMIFAKHKVFEFAV